MRVTPSKAVIGPCLAVAVLASASGPLRAADPENCLSCHRYRGLGRLSDDGESIRLFYVDPRYYDRALGAHARLRCTDCHEHSEVDVVPHHPVSPVDCTRACHLRVPQRTQLRFGHGALAGALDSSIHTTGVLRTSNRLLGRPLGAGQSDCLFCHDEPLFERLEPTWHQQEAPVERCNVCHSAEVLGLPGETRYYYWHVHARSRPARTNDELVRVCAVCHSSPSVREHFELEDSTATYLASFHGKAMLLGSERTAGCLDCHVGQLANVHRMLPSEQPDSPSHRGQLATTCRSASCHATAGRLVSSAAVHLQLATSRGVEYFIAVLFVVLILFTFGPSVLLTSLEMLQAAFRRHDPRHSQRRLLAERLLADEHGRRLLERFNVHQRVQHWLLFLCFTTLVVTGFPIKFADRPWAAWLIDRLGGLSVTRLVHRWAGVVLLAGFVYHILYVALFTWRQKRRTGKSLMRAFLDLPMVMAWSDWKRLWHLLGYLLFFRRTRPEGGRFSLKEKFEYFGVFWGCVLLGVTGLILWANAWTTRYLPGRILTIAALIHTFEAFLALLHVGVIHLVSVVFAPSVFPFSAAMFTGKTPPDGLAESHAAMLEEAQRRLRAATGGGGSHA